MPEHLRAQDATLWNVQTPEAPLQIGALCLFEGAPLRGPDGALRVDDLRRLVAARLHVAPRFRQRLRSLPLDQGLVWVDDEHLDLERHIWAEAIPAPGDRAELRRLVARALEQPLDPTRPLWEIRLIDGVEGDRVAVLVKASHVMVDGMALLAMALSLLDRRPRAHGPADHEPEPPPWRATRPPPTGVLLLSAAAQRTRRQAAALWGFVSHVGDPRTVTAVARALAQGTATPSHLAPALPLTRPVGPRRDFAWLRLPMADLRRAKMAEGATLNDVVLSICAGGIAHYLEDAGLPVPTTPPRALVPVSTHARPGQEVENRFAMMVTDLPVRTPDPRQRLQVVHTAMEQHKRSAQSSLGPTLFSLAELLPQALIRWGGPKVLHHQPVANLAITNLPGSRTPGYLLGARMQELFPFVCGTGNIAVIIGVLSYEEGLGVGITVDPEAVPDVDRLRDGIERAAAELFAAVRPARRARRSPARGAARTGGQARGRAEVGA